MVVFVRCCLVLGRIVNLFSFKMFFFINFFGVQGLLPLVSADAAQPWQLGFQDPATPTIEGIIRFHQDLMFLVILIVIFVG